MADVVRITNAFYNGNNDIQEGDDEMEEDSDTLFKTDVEMKVFSND
jgi:hypothetical protein